MTTSYPTSEEPVGGVFVREHVLAAAPYCDIAVIHLDRRAGVRRHRATTAREQGIDVVRVAYPRSPAAFSYAEHLAAASAGLRSLRGQGFRPDVIHAHFFLAAAPAIVLGRVLRRPVVATEHWSVFLPEDPFRLPPLALWSARAALARAAIVLPVSDALRLGMEAHGIRARYCVVPNSVDTDLFRPISRPQRPATARLLTAGQLYEPKAIDTLLEAVALVVASGRTVRLDIAGDGPLRADYERLARDLRLDGVVTFLGRQSKPEVARLMSQADLFVLTSRFETSACVLIEAQAAGLPTVATNVGAVSETLQPGAGLLARANDPPDVAKHIIRALDSLDDFDPVTISKRAGERFGRDKVGRSLRDIYDKVSADASTRSNMLSRG